MTQRSAQPVRIDYTNWRGERRLRDIIPIRLYFGSTSHHPEPQWLLLARDLEKNERRTFSLKDIHNPQFLSTNNNYEMDMPFVVPVKVKFDT